MSEKKHKSSGDVAGTAKKHQVIMMEIIEKKKVKIIESRLKWKDLLYYCIFQGTVTLKMFYSLFIFYVKSIINYSTI